MSEAECRQDRLTKMANPQQLAKLNEGVETWNQWRVENQEAAVDLSEADLAGKDLTGADLQGALLPHASLRGTKMRHGTLLWQADLQQSDLCEADLSGADLKGVNFAQADLFEASLREADLQSADLSSVKGGLRTEQLAGADLTGAKLPDDLKKLYDSLENVKGISESARKIFLAVLAGCLYCWLTIATTLDVNLITNRASSPLPIIQTPIPIVGFYVVAPLLVLCVYFYFHFYLQKLWEELGSLPAVFPDGRPLHTKVDPWLLNDLVRAHLPRLNDGRPFLSYLQLWISVLLAWWIVPITMFLFWGRYLRRHEGIGTTFHVALLVIALVAAVSLYRLAVATVRGAERVPFTWKLSRRLRLTAAVAALVVPILLGMILVSENSRDYVTVGYLSLVAVGCLYWLVVAVVRLYRFAVGRLRGAERKPFTALSKTAAFTVAAGVLFGLISWQAIRGAAGSFVPVAMTLFGYAPFANLDGLEVSQKKPTWSPKKKDGNDQDLDPVIGAQLFGANLRYASAKRAFFAGANLNLADLSGADLSGTDLSSAHLRGAHLRGANLFDAHLSGADLSNADLSGDDLSNADLSGADLSYAHLSGAHLGFADLSGADLSDAHLSGAHLGVAHLSGANLSGADLGDTDLGDTDLSDADLSNADLRGARLTGADLTHSDFRRAKNVDPEAVKGAQSETWKKALYDCTIIEALHLPLDHNVKLFEELPKDQQDRDKTLEKPPEPCPSQPQQ